MTDIVEIKDKMKDWLSWENIVDNLPLIIAGGVVLIVVDKLVDLGDKMRPMFDVVSELNSDEIGELVDTLGDNMQLVNSVAKAFKVEIDDDWIKKVADVLQNIGTASKLIKQLFQVFEGKAPRFLGRFRRGRSSGKKSSGSSSGYRG